jgi:hypothetical protein
MSVDVTKARIGFEVGVWLGITFCVLVKAGVDVETNVLALMELGLQLMH